MIPYGHQCIDEADIQAVLTVLNSDWLTQGPTIGKFEAAVTDYCQVPHGIAVSSATAALHIACLALGVGPGDRVWTSPNTFVASANCARYCGGTVDFVDIDPDTLNMSPTALAAKLADARRQNALPKVVIPVHFSGRPCDMVAIHALAQEYGFRIIEDAAHAIGAHYEASSAKVGSGEYSDITIFSFHPVKIITSGEGGMAVTRDPALATHLRRLRSHGIAQTPGEMVAPQEGPWHYQQIELGFNYRMTDIHAALGVSQMQKLDGFLQKRRALAAAYEQLLRPLPIQRPLPAQHSAWHLYPIRMDQAIRRGMFEDMRQAGIGVQVHYFPVHLQPYYRQLGFNPGQFPNAEAYYREAFTIPLFPAMEEGDLTTVIATLTQILQKHGAC